MNYRPFVDLFLGIRHFGRNSAIPVAAILLAIVAGSTQHTQAESPWPHRMLRSSDDRNLDLVEALLQRQRFDDAESICQQALKRADPRSDAAAKWAIRFSHALTQRQMSQDKFPGAAIDRAQQPIADLLEPYSDHHRRLFMKAQLAAVEKSSARHAVIIAAVSPQSEQQIDQIFTQLARVTNLYRDLAAEVDTARAARSVQTDLASRMLVDDLKRLHQELQIDVVSMGLLQTDLFAPGSRDYMASASKAEQAADAAINELPSSSQARLEIERLRVQAILRGGELRRAETQLRELFRAVGLPIPPRVGAMLVRIKLAQDDVAQAGRLLDAFYQGSPDAAPLSIEMDLVRLDFLIRQRDRRVGKWLDAIEQRHGAYARRRAEAITLGKLRSTDDTSPSSVNSDPAIVAAQGQDWLRRNQPARAGQLLAAAAQAEPDADRAIQYASEAAAAWVKAKQPTAAANVLYRTAVAKADATAAANAHLQGSLVLATDSHTNNAQRIETELAITCQRWPNSESARKANLWHVEILKRQRRQHDAANVATGFLKYDPALPRIDSALELWRDVIVESDDGDTTDLINQFQSAFAPLLTTAEVASTYAESAVYLVEPESLKSLTLSADATPFAQALADFRSQQRESSVLRSPPESLSGSSLAAARWRLMRDAKRIAGLRKPVAAVLENWPGDSVDDRATLLAWSNDIAAATKLVAGAAKTARRPSQHWRSLAVTLSAMETDESRAAAIKIWGRLASGLPKNDPSWHAAKLAAIELLIQSRQRDEARRRAKYILLTAPPEAADLKSRYEAAAN